MSRILLIEDDLAYEELVTAVLTSSGLFEVRAAQTLEAAAQSMHEFKPDLIIADLNLPDSSGPATLGRIRRYTGETPIIVLTGVDDESSVQRVVDAGAQDYLVKSLIDPRLIARTVQVALKRHGRPAPEDTSPGTPSAVFGFLGSKGGVGTSTCVANTAALLSRSGWDTVAIELETGPGTLSLYLQSPANGGLGTLCGRPPGSITSADVQHLLVEPVAGLYLLPSQPRIPADAPWLTPDQIRAVVRATRQLCTYVILDLPARLDTVGAAALGLCDAAVLVVDREEASVRAAAWILDQGWRAAGLQVEPQIVLVNRSGLERPMPVPEIRERLRARAAVTVPAAAAEIAFAHSARTPSSLLSPESAFTDAHLELADRLLASCGHGAGRQKLNAPHWRPIPEATYS